MNLRWIYPSESARHIIRHYILFLIGFIDEIADVLDYITTSQGDRTRSSVFCWWYSAITLCFQSKVRLTSNIQTSRCVYVCMCICEWMGLCMVYVRVCLCTCVCVWERKRSCVRVHLYIVCGFCVYVYVFCVYVLICVSLYFIVWMCVVFSLYIVFFVCVWFYMCVFYVFVLVCGSLRVFFFACFFHFFFFCECSCVFVRCGLKKTYVWVLYFSGDEHQLVWPSLARWRLASLAVCGPTHTGLSGTSS